MRDIQYDSTAEQEYECPRCGDLVTARSHPGTCTDCDTTFRNRGTPLE